MLPEFHEVMDTLLNLQNQYPNLSWDVTHAGVVQVSMYVGVENTDLLKAGRVMFAPAE